MAGQGRVGAAPGGGRGRMGGTKPGSGPGGTCVCPKCGNKASHKVGQPCYQMVCSKCGARMVKA